MNTNGVKTLAAIGAVLLGIAAAQNTTNGTHSDSTIDCADGLKIFVSRGTGEAAGAGVTGNLTDLIASQIVGSDVQGIAYPATFEDPDYFLSVSNGTRLLKQEIVEYSQACPDSKIALFGYSQGAQTTSNALCGQPVVWAFDASNGLESDLDVRQLAQTFINSQPLPQNFTRNIIATVLLGDPSHQSNATYSAGNATGNGIFWRGDLSACEAMGSRIRSYCTAGDPFCDVGNPINTDAEAHLTYVNDYGKEVVAYVVEQYKNGGLSNGTSGRGGGATSTDTARQESAGGRRLIASGSVIMIALIAFFLS